MHFHRSALHKTMILLVGVISLTTNVATVPARDLIPYGSSWSYLMPLGLAEDPSLTDPDFETTWFRRNYSTTSPLSWSGPAAEPIEYGSIDAFNPDSQYLIREAQTVLEAPASGDRYTTYFRREFTTTEAATGLAIELLADDGAKVYLDDREIAAVNCCQGIPAGEVAPFDALSLALGSERTYLLGGVMSGETLAAGPHLLAVAVHNQSETSSDLGFSMRLLDGFTYEKLVETGTEWKYFEGWEEPSNGTLAWTTTGFADTSWSEGQEGFGYDTGDPTALPLINTYLEDAELELYTTVYLRQQFSVANPDKLDTLVLSIDYDDAFFAYINGQQVFSSHADPDGDATTPIPYDTNGVDDGFDHESTNASGAPGSQRTVSLESFPGLLKPGRDNVLAIQGINRSPSSDFVLAQIGLFGVGIEGDDPGIVGDYSANGELDVVDLDLQAEAMVAGGPVAIYDLNTDGTVDFGDREAWLHDLKRVWVGDSDLSGEFNSGDFVQAFAAGKYETGQTATWDEGDWSGDQVFDSGDFVAAFADGGYEAGPRPAAVRAIPEPNSLMLSLLSLVGLTLTTARGRRLATKRR